MRKKTTLWKRGNPFVRKALYFPTVTAFSHNPLIKSFYERLVASGKRRRKPARTCLPRPLPGASGP